MYDVPDPGSEAARAQDFIQSLCAVYEKNNRQLDPALY